MRSYCELAGGGDKNYGRVSPEHPVLPARPLAVAHSVALVRPIKLKSTQKCKALYIMCPLKCYVYAVV